MLTWASPSPASMKAPGAMAIATKTDQSCLRGLNPGKSTRPPISLRSRRMFIGVEIGGTKLQVVAGDGHRGIARRWRGTVQAQFGSEGIRSEIERAVKSMLMDEPGVRAIGVGFGGPVDWRA